MGFFALLLILGTASIVIAIATAVSASRYPDWAFQQSGSGKLVWILLPIVFVFVCWPAGGIMGIIWFASKREVIASGARAGGPQYGFGPPQQSGYGPPQQYGYGAPQPPGQPGWGPPPGGGWGPPQAPGPPQQFSPQSYPPPPPPPPPAPPTDPPQ